MFWLKKKKKLRVLWKINSVGIGSAMAQKRGEKDKKTRPNLLGNIWAVTGWADMPLSLTAPTHEPNLYSPTLIWSS